MKWKPLRFAALYGIAVLTTIGQTGTTTTFRPELDTSIHSSGSNPKGTATILAGNRRAIDILDRGLLRFDLSAIPGNATIESASLRLGIVQVPLNPVFAPFELHRVNQAWAGDATWANATANLPWSAPGAAAGTDYAAAAIIGERVPASGEYLFAESNQLIEDIRGWINNPAINHGWILISADETTLGTAIHFGSSESTVPPLLEIGYSVPLNAPELRDVKLVSTNFTFQIHGGAGKSYAVQTLADISSSWLTITNVGTGPKETSVLVTLPAADPQQFIRVEQN